MILTLIILMKRTKLDKLIMFFFSLQVINQSVAKL